ncbi:hypothetical protein BH10ACT7_BH10ACT7_14660 [soil metagenome]
MTTLLDSTTVIVLPSVDGLDSLSDVALIDLQRQAGAARQQVDARLAAIAGEVRRRSDRSLGHAGLAARLGAASAEKAIQSLTGVSFTEAKALTTVGAALGSPWLIPVQQAVANGSLSLASAAAVASGLGTPDARVASDDLQDAAADLGEFAKQSTPENTARAARQVRDQLDLDGVADREAHRRSRRSLKWFEQADGMTRMIAVLDPESAAVVTSAIDAVMSPRRGGPRFVESRSITDDPRTNEQLAVDTLVDIVGLAVRAADGSIDSLFGDRTPAVRVHVQASALGTGTGVSFVEGSAGSLSVSTAQRHICTSGIIPVLFRGTQPIDVGRTHRLHSVRQRIAIAAQWNGCPWGDCDRPPSMTEVHHIEAFDGTNTTVANGISLCRFHHMELHANGWRIQIEPDDTYWLIPPPALDRHQVPIPLRTRSPFAGSPGLA